MKYQVSLNGKQFEVEVEKGAVSAVPTGAAPAPAPAAAAPAPTAAPQAAPAAPAPAAAPAPTAAPAEEENLTDDTELVSVITAAIAAYEGKETVDNGLVVRSIKRVSNRNWN